MGQGQTVQAHPTKSLFIYVLTRDLSLQDAVNDLVDNCVDGAKRLSPKGDYSNFEVRITLSKNRFEIKDNCGGIPIDVARNYAFRFGRPEGAVATDFSIGQFGVGMKRALFKLGREFTVTSTAQSSTFEIDVNVEEWLEKKDEDGHPDWSFSFNKGFRENEKRQTKKVGTTIAVGQLNNDVTALLESTDWLDDLKRDIESRQMENIQKGLSIFLNGSRCRQVSPQFRVSKHIKVSKHKETLDSGVEIEIHCGLGEPDLTNGGWYIFCNDRLLLGPEQTSISGWTGTDGDGVANYHGQYRYFRGVISFKARDSSLLPWNTAKNNIDAESTLYQYARGKMIDMMKPYIKYMNSIKKDRESGEDGEPKKNRPYEEEYNNAKRVKMSKLTTSQLSSTFSVPVLSIEKPKRNSVVNIQYRLKKADADLLKKHMRAKSYRDIGKVSLQYYVENEEVEIDLNYE